MGPTCVWCYICVPLQAQEVCNDIWDIHGDSTVQYLTAERLQMKQADAFRGFVFNVCTQRTGLCSNRFRKSKELTAIAHNISEELGIGRSTSGGNGDSVWI